VPSYYDPEKKCRAGVMDEAQFHAECGPESGPFFRGLLGRWAAEGGAFRWGAGGVGLRGVVAGKEVAVCFFAPRYGGKQDRIEFSCSALVKLLGQGRNDELMAAVRSAAGGSALGKTMVSVVRPGSLTEERQAALAEALLALLAGE
jgi:hypothetical protein